MFNFKNIEVNQSTYDYIINNLTQEEIWYYYVPEFTIGKVIKSPLRNDNNPSFSFKKLKDGVIIFKDWSKNDWKGDIFKYLQIKFNVSFNEAANIVYNDLIKNKPTTYKPIEYNVYKEPKVIKEKTLVPYFQTYKIEDIKFWGKYGISISTLLKFNVKSCKSVLIWSNKREVYFPKFYSVQSPMYCYMINDIETGKTYYKIYKPYDKEWKWLFNGTSNCISGYSNLPWIGDTIILTKSLKDVMCLYELGYNSISLQGETNEFKVELYNKLKKRFKNIYCLYDNDETGIEGMKVIYNTFKIPYIIIPYDQKDISDLYKEQGKEITINFLKEHINE